MISKYIKLFLILGAAFVVSDFGIKNIFLAKSPKLNPFFTQNMLAKINNFRIKTTNFFAFKKVLPNNNLTQTQAPSNNLTQTQVAQSPKVAFKLEDAPKDLINALSAPVKKVSQGVYAGEKNDTKVYEVRSDEIEYLEQAFSVNGKEIKIKVPKGQEPPSQEFLEVFSK